jgi:hypothetical protein
MPGAAAIGLGPGAIGGGQWPPAGPQLARRGRTLPAARRLRAWAAQLEGGNWPAWQCLRPGMEGHPAGSRPARAGFRSPLRLRYPESAEIRGRGDSDTASGGS